MRVQDLMSHPPIVCDLDDSADVAARRMWDHDCGVIAVVDEGGRLVGMITDRDICMAASSRGQRLADIPVSTAMAKLVFSVHPDETISDVERLMVLYQIRRLPVIDDDGIPIGVISLNDLALESARPDTTMENGLANVAYTLAAISRPRDLLRRAA